MTENTLDKDLQNQEFQEQKSGGHPAWLVLSFLVALVFGVLMLVRHVQASDPYIQAVLAVSGDTTRGQEIFQMNCAVCHGLEGYGEVGPSLLEVSARKSKVNLIKQVVSGKTPPMPQFQPNPQDMADLLKYLESL